MRAKITVRSVTALQPGELVWDVELPGFAARRQTPGGAVSFVLQYRHRRRQRWLTLGRWPGMKPEAARRLARARLGDLAEGHDPAGARDALRAIPTLEAFARRYLAEVSSKLKPGSHANNLRYWSRHIKPALGKEPLDTLNADRLARFHHTLAATPTQANRCLALLSSMLTMAERWRLVPGPNPARLVERFRERQKERYLSDEELAWA